MKRTTIMADEEFLDDLRRIAREDGVPLAEVIRDALRTKAAQRKPRLKGKGAFRSGLPPGRLERRHGVRAASVALVVDTGPLLAALDVKDRDHARCDRKVATLDHRHFGVIRPAHTRSLRLLPDA
jgi:hypothetical protein